MEPSTLIHVGQRNTRHRRQGTHTRGTEMNDHSVTARITEDEPVIVRYELIDSRTGRLLGTYKHRAVANNRRDKLDNEYGAYRYKVRAVWSDEE